MAFNGFTKESITFLKELAANNNKEWFEKNRETYQNEIFLPLKQLAIDLGPVINKIDEKIDITPQFNRTISRIYRDTRFSNDKSPFRTDQWLSFKRPVKIFGNVPEFFFYITPEEYHTGMGYYAATPLNMEKFRSFVDNHPDHFDLIIKNFESDKKYQLLGDEYKKRIPNPHPEKFQDWYNKKSFYVACSTMIDRKFFSPELGREIADRFRFEAELYSFIIEAISI